MRASTTSLGVAGGDGVVARPLSLAAPGENVVPRLPGKRVQTRIS